MWCGGVQAPIGLYAESSLFDHVDDQRQAARLDAIIGDVMQDVAVKHPGAQFRCDKFDVVALARRDT